MARAKRRIGNVDSLSYKKMAERAVNSPKIAEVTEADAALDELVKFDAKPRYQGNRMLSPFGHNATAQNGDIDFALCSGARTLDELVDKVHVYRKTRKADIKDRKGTATCVINHMGFLAGKNNGKNRLADRLIRFMGDNQWDAACVMEKQVHDLCACVYPRMKAAYKRQYPKNA